MQLITLIALLFQAPFTGGSFNPARSFAPALYEGNWKSHWIYWVAPLLSASATSFLFRLVFWIRQPEASSFEELPLRKAQT